MAIINSFKYGDLVLVNIDDNPESNETNQNRHAVIVSADVINDNLNTVIVCPVIEANRVSDTRIGATYIPQKAIGLEKDSLVISIQIKTIAKDRIVKRIGSLPSDYMYQIRESLQAVLDLVA